MRGMIGALAAVGLAASRNDGRVVVNGDWPDDLSGLQSVAVVSARGIQVLDIETETPITTGDIDVGQHLRPNFRAGQIVLFAGRGKTSAIWQAIRLT